MNLRKKIALAIAAGSMAVAPVVVTAAQADSVESGTHDSWFLWAGGAIAIALGVILISQSDDDDASAPTSP